MYIYVWQLAYTHLHIHSNNLVFFLHLLPTSTFTIYQSFTLFFNVDSMIMAAFITFCLFIMIISATAFLDRQLAVSFETKYDNNHNEIKQLLTKNKQFDVTNWTHYALFIQLVVNIIVIIAFVIYTCTRCRQLFRLAHTSKQQPITSNLLSIHQLPCPPPYAHSPPSLYQPLSQPYSSVLSTVSREPNILSRVPSSPIVS